MLYGQLLEKQCECVFKNKVKQIINLWLLRKTLLLDVQDFNS